MSDKDKLADSGNYEVLQNRLSEEIEALKTSLSSLNQARKETFGNIEQKLIATERISTANNCVPRDMIAIGDKLLFGFNVHIGLKAQVDISDVFSVHAYQDHAFHALDNSMLADTQFEDDFSKLYKYYKHTTFIKFARRGPFLFMIFRIGKATDDIKAFKWEIRPDGLTYIDNRSEHEYAYPPQHEFTWKKTTRDDQRTGKHPHISIEDKLFVETIGGDLTIKVENNTDRGQGIYQEEVEDKDQTLDDSEIYYAVYGSLVLLKIRPYREDAYRYLVFNSKMQQVRNIPSIEEACIFLPDDQGILFTNGYYLQSGDYKIFEKEASHLKYEQTIPSPNGEDFLYVFYENDSGNYLLLPFNIIQRQMNTPIWCHGYALYANGELAYFTGEDQPKKHHVVRIWQTTFTDADFELPHANNNYLSKVGNKDIVRAMAECQEIITLFQKGEDYDGLYVDLSRQATDVIDSYYWLNHEEAFHVHEPLDRIRQAANAAIDEFEKVVRLRRETAAKIREVFSSGDEHIRKTSRESGQKLETYVARLTEYRKLIGETEALRQLRFADEEEVDQQLTRLREAADSYAAACVRFLLRPEALKPYEERIRELAAQTGKVTKVSEATETELKINQIARDLEMLIEVVSNLKIDDATQTTEIIENISSLFAQVNQERARLKKHRQQLSREESRAEFVVQMKLIDQSLTNYLDLSDTPAKCEEFLSKILIQVEEMETRFGEFEDFILDITEKREAVVDAFESRKNVINEELGRKRQMLAESGQRILKSIENRVMNMEDRGEIQAYFTTDLMIEKVRGTINRLRELDDPVRADDLAGQLKALREDAFRQLSDRQELYADGEDLIRLGNFQFSINTQKLELSIIPRQGHLSFYLGGTSFYEPVADKSLEADKALWDQVYPSESTTVYRAEYLAYTIFDQLRQSGKQKVEEYAGLGDEKLLDTIRKEMSQRFNEGYAKGIHDEDALGILRAVIRFYQEGGPLAYPSRVRALAVRFWLFVLEDQDRKILNDRLKGLGLIYSVFKNPSIYTETCLALMPLIQQAYGDLFEPAVYSEAARYLAEEISRESVFVVSGEAVSLAAAFRQRLKEQKAGKAFKESVEKAGSDPHDQFSMVCEWLRAFLNDGDREFLDEAALFLLREEAFKPADTPMKITLESMKGTHSLISEKNELTLNFNNFFERLFQYARHHVPAFIAFQHRKQELIKSFSEELRLDTFKPRVMSSFVRNKLINDVYLPLIGANLAKQIGEAGVNQRTDLMGLLLLISPPGYGKTTLMEYIANRLGLVFMKINGPSIGHDVTSVDPAGAPSATARQELEKLNLAFEMGDNIMIYLDDIQHVNPEFLQKFISLCDAQRKIEGVYKGKTRTYDFRGKKVCVVMAGNPYTESGEKFAIPDMLANRADIYNLGDIIGNTEQAFKMSYIENCMTSNQTLNELAGKGREDIYALLQAAENGQPASGESLTGSYSPDELADYTKVLGMLLKVRDVIMSVNNEYVKSAAQADEFRTEPPFKLQGSYRDMNKIAGKVFPVMNEKELMVLLSDHYENEAQSLTRGAEFNLLKYRQLTGQMTKEDEARWKYMLEVFMKQQKRKGYGDNATGQLVESMEDISDGIRAIGKALKKPPAQENGT